MCLENPADVGVFPPCARSHEAAKVKPNTFVRMARQVGFEGYDDFREPFREAIRRGQVSYPDRVRWLQEVRKSGDLGGLYADQVAAAIRNIEETFAAISAEALKAAAEDIWNSRQVFVMGVGVNNANARNFTYLAGTGMTRFHTIPRAGSVATDDLAWADKRDVLIAITCHPYRVRGDRRGAHRARAGGHGGCHLGQPRQPDHPDGATRVRRRCRHAAILPVLGLDHRASGNAASALLSLSPARKSLKGSRNSTNAATSWESTRRNLNERTDPLARRAVLHRSGGVRG